MFSVLIRCKNEDNWIGHSIQSVLDLVPEPEVIIIDDHSTDDSMDVVRMFEHHSNVRYHLIDDYSPGRALNEGVRLASSDKILVLSAHCVLTKFDHEKLSSDLEEYVAIFGKQIPTYRGRRITPRYVWSNFTDDRTVNMISEIENRPFLHNAMCLYTKRFLIDHPFNAKLYGKEDRYWAKSVIDEGHNILYDPQMECIHHWTPMGATWKGIG